MSKTKSEELFETYLRDRGIDDFEYEPQVPGISKRPDYRVSIAEKDIFFEVKEFIEHVEPPPCGTFDPSILMLVFGRRSTLLKSS